MKRELLVFLGMLLLAASAPASADTVMVKYRGPVKLDNFSCESVNRSSLVKRVCYQQTNRYMVISLSGTYYHYCRIGPEVVGALMQASSIGRFYNQSIKGQYDCRAGGVPNV